MEHCQEQAGQAAAEAAAAAPDSIGRLPHELLARVLAHVPLAQRLAAAALACRAWAAAAVAATRVISAQRLSEPQVAALSAWLAANGAAAAVASLEVDTDAWTRVLRSFQLPASQLSATLTRLSLRHLEVTVTASAPDDSQQQAPSSLAALTALTRLKLSWCTVSLEGLAALRGLWQLELHLKDVPEGEDLSAVVGQALPALAQLTRLVLTGGPASGRGDLQDAALAQLSSLVQLRELRISSSAVTAASFAVPLPGSLTLLEVYDAESVAFSPSTTPGLAQATALRRLSVSGAAELQPAVLEQLSQLQELTLWECQIPGLFASPRLPALTRLETDTRLVGCEDEVARLAAACSTLASLRLLAGLAEDDDDDNFTLDLSGLAPLSGLTRLELGTRGCGGLQQLRGLRSLKLRITADDAEALAAACKCTQLEELELELEGRRNEDYVVMEYHVQLRNKAPPGQPPDVVQQLCALPSVDDDASRAQLLASLLPGVVIQQLEERNVRLTQQVQQQAQQLEQQAQQLEQLAQQLEQQAQQLAAAQARVAQLEAVQQQQQQ